MGQNQIYSGTSGNLVGFSFSVEVNLLMAKYKCASCGKESDAPGMCCGQQMKEIKAW